MIGHPRFRKPHMRGEGGEGDAGVDRAIAIKHRRTKPVKGKAAAALPAHRLADPALFAVDHFGHARCAVGDSMIAHLNPDPAPPHLVRYGGGETEPKKESKIKSPFFEKRSKM